MKSTLYNLLFVMQCKEARGHVSMQLNSKLKIVVSGDLTLRIIVSGDIYLNNRCTLATYSQIVRIDPSPVRL